MRHLPAGVEHVAEAEQVQSGVDLALRRVIQDGVASQAMATLTSGPFLVAFALALGADMVVVGLLASLTALSQFAQVPGVWIVDRFRDRRMITFAAAAASRLFWLAIAAAPFLFPDHALAVVVTAFFLFAIAGGVAGTAWNSWMRDLVPEGRTGSFFSHRTMVMTLFGLPLLLAAGWAVDLWPTHWPAPAIAPYSTLFVLGVVAGLIGLFFLVRTPEPVMAPRTHGQGFFTMLKAPLKDRNFRRLLHFLIAWSLAVNLAAPFFTVYMLQQIGLSMGTVIAMLVLSQAVYAYGLRVWGRYADHYGHRSVLALSAPLFLVAVFLWTFTTLPHPTSLTLPLVAVIHVAMGASMAGFVLATNNLALKLAPRGEATAYLATSSMATAAAAGIAPLAGGLFVGFFATRTLRLDLQWLTPNGSWTLPALHLQQWDFFFAFAVLVGIYALHRLTAVEEQGRIDEKMLLGTMVSDIRQEMRNMSSVAGLRSAMQFPLTLLRRRPPRDEAMPPRSDL